MSNKSAEFLEIASGILESAVGALLKATDSIDSRRMSFPMLQGTIEEEQDGIDAFLASAQMDATMENGFYEMSMES